MRYYWGLAVGHIYGHAIHKPNNANIGQPAQPTSQPSMIETFLGPSNPLHATDLTYSSLDESRSLLEADEPIDIEGDDEAEDEAALDDDDMVYGECDSDSGEGEGSNGDDDRDSDGMDEVFEATGHL